MEKKMDTKKSVRLPRLMGPVERWQGQCKPIDAHDPVSGSELSEDQETILSWIREFYSEYIIDEYLVKNRGETVVVLNCEYPRFEAFEAIGFNLTYLENLLNEDGEEKVKSYFRVPKPYHWETGARLNLESD